MSEKEKGRNIAEMSVGEFIRVVANYYKQMEPTRAKPFMSIGPVGCGKTEGWAQIGELTGVKTIMRHLSQIHPLDFGGVIADPVTKALIFAKSPLVQEVEDAIRDASDKRALLVFDELDRVQAMALNACLQVLSERKQNGFKLGDAYIGAAGNGWHDIHTFELSKAALSRLNVVSVQPRPEEWLAWAADHNVDPRVVITIAMAPDVLNQHGELPDGSWKVADPRAWVDLSTALKCKAIAPEYASTFIGKHAATTFMQYVSFSRDYSKDIQAVVKGSKINVEKYPVKQREAILFGCYLAAAGQITKVDAAYDYLKNAVDQIGDEKTYISGKLLTYNIPMQELSKHEGIHKIHVKIYKTSTADIE